jgi:hypothetical protein
VESVEEEPKWMPWLKILESSYPNLDLSDPVLLLFTKTYLRQKDIELHRESIEGEDYPTVCIPKENKQDFLEKFEAKFHHLEAVLEMQDEEDENAPDALTQSSRKYIECVLFLMWFYLALETYYVFSPG